MSERRACRLVELTAAVIVMSRERITTPNCEKSW